MVPGEIRQESTEDQLRDIVDLVKEEALEKRRTLTDEEVVSIIDKVRG